MAQKAWQWKFHGNVRGEVRANFLTPFASKPHIWVCGALKLSGIVRTNVCLNIAIPMLFWTLSHEDGGVVTGHVGTNTRKFVPPRWGRPRIRVGLELADLDPCSPSVRGASCGRANVFHGFRVVDTLVRIAARSFIDWHDQHHWQTFALDFQARCALIWDWETDFYPVGRIAISQWGCQTRTHGSRNFIQYWGWGLGKVFKAFPDFSSALDKFNLWSQISNFLCTSSPITSLFQYRQPGLMRKVPKNCS